MNSTLSKNLAIIGSNVRTASRQLSTADSQAKNIALRHMADSISDARTRILEANQQDMQRAAESNTPASFLDRLRLDEDRIASMAAGILSIAELDDPVGKILATTKRPNQLLIEKVAMPIGVIGVIFESRPNVTADAAALCLKSGNGVVLRGGSAAHKSNVAIFESMVAGLVTANFDRNVIQLIQTTDRDAVGVMLSGMFGNIDVIVPRGGKNLVERVQEESRVPVFAHLQGICHTYVHADADPKMAIEVVLNAKMRRTGICGATETLLIDRAFDVHELRKLLSALHDHGCEVRGDKEISEIFSAAKPATQEDWTTEYLDAIVAVKMVDDVYQAIEHIDRFGTDHTEAIITDNQAIADTFLSHVGSSIVMHNTSTQFADGGEFGMGAEIGIATGKLHARGPVGVKQLTTFKYVVRGAGQARP